MMQRPISRKLIMLSFRSRQKLFNMTLTNWRNKSKNELRRRRKKKKNDRDKKRLRELDSRLKKTTECDFRMRLKFKSSKN